MVNGLRDTALDAVQPFTYNVDFKDGCPDRQITETEALVPLVDAKMNV